MKKIIITLTLLISFSFEMNADDLESRFLKVYDNHQLQMKELFKSFLNNNLHYKELLTSVYEKEENMQLLFIPLYMLEGDTSSVDSSSNLLNYINLNKKIISFDVYVINNNEVNYTFSRIGLWNSVADYIGSDKYGNNNFELNKKIRHMKDICFKIYPFPDLWLINNNELSVYSHFQNRLYLDTDKFITELFTEYEIKKYFNIFKEEK